jgi:proteic killer suppression protein
MIVTFEKEYLEELYSKGTSRDKKHRYQPEIVRKYKFCINALKTAPSVEQLYKAKALNYEMLKGDKAGISSIRVNVRYRIEFTVKHNASEPILTVCNILELSNHYN